jgi:hypothetical protein
LQKQNGLFSIPASLAYAFSMNDLLPIIV